MTKCQLCYKLGHSCCRTQPAMSEEELARIYFKYDQSFFDDTTVTRMGNNTYVVVPSSIVDDKGNADISKEYCVFFDKSTGLCKIYDDRPQVCKDFGEVEELPCPFSNVTTEELEQMSEDQRQKLVDNANKISKNKAVDYILKTESFIPKPLYKIQKIDKKLMKKQKEIMLMSVVVYYLETTVENLKSDFLTVDFRYKLGLLPDGKMTAIRIPKLKTNDINFKPVVELHNKLYNKVMSINPDYLEVIVNKINRLIDGIQQKECKYSDDKDYLLYLLFAVMMYMKYMTEYKNKSKEFSGFIKYSDLMNFVYFVVEQTGGFKGNSRFEFNDVVNCVSKNVEMLYNAIIKNK